ncbi:unnamed protein product [marine sediment metagenome]|uniref:Uncharacterized protein n=1 Tax=marine sediment metagenome TaxID=412755 RepID=X1P481_9ZZZZ
MIKENTPDKEKENTETITNKKPGDKKIKIGKKGHYALRVR